MKISASIYSDNKRSLKEVIEDLEEHQVDLLHMDCHDDLSVFEDIREIRTISNIPVDLHIISDSPEKFYDLLIETPVEYVTFQYENLKSPLEIPSDVKGMKGIAVTTHTSVQIFEEYKNFDFILIMATIPGQSGGKFDTINFRKIREFRNSFPGKSIHVDGGINAEVSFILRNMGVRCSVCGSYLFNSASIGNALMNLTKRDTESLFSVGDFMIPIEESPTVKSSNLTLKSILQSIEKGNLGFTLVESEDGLLEGLISNADVRRGFLNHLDNLNEIKPSGFLNQNPITILDTSTVFEMIQLIKSCKFPVMYLPVLNKDGFAKGIITFMNLIKGEL